MKYELNKNGIKPLQSQLADAIRHDIRSGLFPPGMALPPVTTIAVAAGVSLRTADLALKELVTERICIRRPKKGTYVADATNSTSRQICGIWSQFELNNILEHPMTYEMYSGVLEASQATDIAATSVLKEPDDLIRRFQHSPEFDFMGVLTFDYENFDDTVKLARQFPQYRFGFLNFNLDKLCKMPPNMFAVVNDDYLGGRQLARFHLNQGIRRFALLSMGLQPHDIVYKERLRGFEEEITLAGGSVCCHTVLPYFKEIEKCKPLEYEFLESLDDAPEFPEALLCVNDILARNACRFFAEKTNRHVPKISGYDGFLPDFYTQNEHASIRVPFRKMGRKALKILSGTLPLEDKNGQIFKVSPDLQVISSCDNAE